jgi:hypothetical protein
MASCIAAGCATVMKQKLAWRRLLSSKKVYSKIPVEVRSEGDNYGILVDGDSLSVIEQHSIMILVASVAGKIPVLGLKVFARKDQKGSCTVARYSETHFSFSFYPD